MGKSTIKTVLGVAVLSLLSSIPALAADLILNVDSSKRAVAITNTLPTAVTLLYLEGLDRNNLPLHARIEKGATVNAPLRFVMPASVGQAVGEVEIQRRYLTVELNH